MSSSPFFSERLAVHILSSKHRLNANSLMPPTRYFWSHSSEAQHLILSPKELQSRGEEPGSPPPTQLPEPTTLRRQPAGPNLLCDTRCPPAATSSTVGLWGFCCCHPCALSNPSTNPAPPCGRRQARGTNLNSFMRSRNCPDNLSDTGFDMELQPGSCRELHQSTTKPKPPAGRSAGWAGSAGTRTAAANCFGDTGRGNSLQHPEKTW